MVTAGRSKSLTTGHVRCEVAAVHEVLVSLALETPAYCRDVGRKSPIIQARAFDARVRGGSPSEYCHTVCCGKTGMVWLPDSEKV